MRNGSDEPTEFGYFVLNLMGQHDPPLTQTALAAVTGVGQATISRWIFTPGRPNPDKLRALADALGIGHDELLQAAGYAKRSQELSAALAASKVDRLASELSTMLDETSPLSEDDRQFLRHTVDRLMDPYRKSMRRRRSAS